MRGLAAALSAGNAPIGRRVDLMVLEERNPRNLSNLDRKHIAAMRSEGLIHRSMQAVLTHQSSSIYCGCRTWCRRPTGAR
jgi:hypothetical protein